MLPKFSLPRGAVWDLERDRVCLGLTDGTWKGAAGPEEPGAQLRGLVTVNPQTGPGPLTPGCPLAPWLLWAPLSLALGAEGLGAGCVLPGPDLLAVSTRKERLGAEGQPLLGLSAGEH